MNALRNAILRLIDRRRSIATIGALLVAIGTTIVMSACTTRTPIRHIVIVVQENRSFNSLFMGFPGANTATTGACKPLSRLGLCTHGGRIALHPITLETCRCFGGRDIQHNHAGFEIEYDDGKMDGFDLIGLGTTGRKGPAGPYPYAYVVKRETQPYWNLARRYALADEMFSTATTNSFVAHQQLIAATTRLNPSESLTDVPNGYPWGCDAPPGTRTAIITVSGLLRNDGPFPCITQYRTMADVLDAARVGWTYYVDDFRDNGGDLSGGNWNAFDAIEHVRYDKDWRAHIFMPNTTIFRDIDRGKLPAVAWVIPSLLDSDHPLSGSNSGPSWVAAVVNAIGRSSYWKDTAIIVVWDDWGGFYDNVAPAQLDYTSLGMRVPMILISPWAKRGFVSHTHYEFGSILKFVEETFSTASLGATDTRAASIDDLFDYTQTPRPFISVPASYPSAYFLGRRVFPKPSALVRAVSVDGD